MILHWGPEPLWVPGSLLCRQEAVHRSRAPLGVFTLGDQEVTPNIHSTDSHSVHVFWKVDYRGQQALIKTAHTFAWLTSSTWCDGQLDRPVPTVGCVIWEQVDREAWRAAIHGVAESDMTERLIWSDLIWSDIHWYSCIVTCLPFHISTDTWCVCVVGWGSPRPSEQCLA